MLTLYELARGLAGQASISDTGDVIAKHLRRLDSFVAVYLLLYDPQTDDLEAAHAFGEASSMVKGFRIPLGQRLSGWVAANRQTIVNSDPSLDLGDVARTVTPRLRSCLSTPLLAGDQLVGVLTVYSALADGFNEDHRRVIEAVAKQIGHTLKRATDFDAQYRRDALTGLPNVAQLEHLLDSSGAKEHGEAHVLTLLLLDVVELKRINTLYGRDAGDEALLHVVRHTRASLRIADLLFRHGSDEFVVLLNEADAQTAADHRFKHSRQCAKSTYHVERRQSHRDRRDNYARCRPDRRRFLTRLDGHRSRASSRTILRPHQHSLATPSRSRGPTSGRVHTVFWAPGRNPSHLPADS